MCYNEKIGLQKDDFCNKLNENGTLGGDRKMPEKSRRQKVAEACLWLPVYARYGGSTGDFPGGQPDYMGEEAQAYLRRNTDPCFAELAALQKEFERNFKALKQQVRAATQICEELMTLKKARAELRMSDICALETIEAEIDVLKTRGNGERFINQSGTPCALAAW